MDISIIISMLTMGGAFMLGLLLFTVRLKNRHGNLFLGLFLCNLTYLELEGFLEEVLELDLNYSIDGTQFILVFLFMYLVTTINRPFKKWYLLLFLPGLIVITCELIRTIGGVYIPDSYLDSFRTFYLIELFLLVYFFRILEAHRIRTNEFYSNIELKTLSWLKVLVLLVLAFNVSIIIESIFFEENMYLGALQSILLFGMVYWIGYNGFSQPEIFEGGFFYEEKTKEVRTVKSIQVSPSDFLKLEQKITEGRIYARQNLTLRDLAEEVAMKEKDISALIKQHSGTTFYHFINRFRIEEFKNNMNSTKSKQLSVFGLAQEVGFSSKSTFYAAFKAVEGMTPKQYESKQKEFD